MRMGRWILVAILVAAVAALPLATAQGADRTPMAMRYCQPPDLAGAYIAATPNVGCGIASAAVSGITTRRCWHREQCDIRGFVCIAYWSGSFSRPFSFTHHGICVARRQRRIEFDLS